MKKFSILLAGLALSVLTFASVLMMGLMRRLVHCFIPGTAAIRSRVRGKVSIHFTVGM